MCRLMFGWDWDDRHYMENHHLLFIQDFAETLSGIFKNMAMIMRKHSEKMKEERPQLARARNDLALENRKIMELQEIIKQKFKGAETTEQKPPEPKKRPLTAFALFLADHRDKILVQHPGLDFHKIATLASYKWKKLSREGQMVYEKKLEEINKISDEELMKAKRVENSDACLVKREYEQEEESKRDEHEENQPQHNQSEQTQVRANQNEANVQPMQEQKNNPDEEHSEPSAPNNANQPIQPLQATLLMENQSDNHATLPLPSQQDQ